MSYYYSRIIIVNDFQRLHTILRLLNLKTTDYLYWNFNVANQYNDQSVAVYYG